ncbi:MAG: hypothetical protein K0S68_753 [Candidatus Saccharibacteria bacterium]|nr:hypothetical protein [Candidatus Saccharibacteria bacterium]
MTDSMVFTLTMVGVLTIVLALLRLRHVSVQGLALGLIGAIIGLLLGALASAPLSKLPEPLGGILPLAVSLTTTVVMVVILLIRRDQILGLVPFLKVKDKVPAEPSATSETSSLPRILVDTSVIIDGRIADIAAAGFVPGRLAVPRFVLAELQNIADSDDAMRRGRGRRGLEVLNQLREMKDVEVEIIDDDVSGIREVDAKLVALGLKFKCNVLTTDYNLNRVAQIQGVRVLNVNELSNAIRPVVLPGEELVVRVVQQGKERNQGVGYLADGTMIVVENGDKLIGQEVSTEVTRVFQTVAGKMIFAVPRKTLSQPTPAAPAPEVAAVTTDSGSTEAKSDARRGDDKDKDRRNNRFGRNRKRGNGNGNVNAGQRSPEASAEDRIIAATSKPHRPEAS